MEAERDVSEVDERIRSLDPFAGATYEHADATAMIERVTSGAAPRRRRRMSVLLGPLAVASAAGLATVGVLATAGTTSVQTGGGTPLAIRGAVHARVGTPVQLKLVYGDEAFALSSAASPERVTKAHTYLFAVGTPLLTTSPPIDAYAAIAPRHPASVLASGAAHLGLTATVRSSGASTWRLDRLDAHVLRQAILTRSQDSGLDVFSYVRDPGRSATRCGADAASGDVDTDRQAMWSTLTGLLATLGVRYGVAAPTFSTSWSSVGRSPCAGTVEVSAAVVVGGVATDQVVQAAFDPRGAVVAAVVPVFSVGRRAAYPLVSPARAAASLVTAAASAVATKGLPETSGHRPARYIPSPKSDLMVVELQAPSVALRAFPTSAGTTWLLPVYAFVGDGFAQRAATPTVWSGDVLATARPLVRVVGSRDNQAHVYDLREAPTTP